MRDTTAITPLLIRTPDRSDGPQMWSLVKKSKTLDLNSSYFYAAMSHWFSDTCRLAINTANHSLIGIVIGFRVPSDKDILFIWQIAVDEQYRGQGIAMKLLEDVALNSDIRLVQATISPSNLPSKRLFEKWSKAKQAPMTVSEGFGEHCFPDQQHEKEDLYQIGPLNIN